MSLIQPWDDFSQLQAEFDKKGRLQLRGFLARQDAENLRAAVKALDWRLVLNENGKHIDIHPLQVSQLGSKKVRLIKQAAQARAKQEFQYLFENYPVFDILESGNPIDPLIKAAFEALNAPAFRQRLSALTRLPVDYCDIQATRYRAGHFLNKHDDNLEGKNRQLAFVLNLSQRWRSSWGGGLAFMDDEGAQEEIFQPVFNSLSLFKVPTFHEVTRVTSAAKSSRLALTGWFRTH